MKTNLLAGYPVPRLGDLEMAVMELMWRQRGAEAKAVCEAMGERDISLSTVQSTLERLFRKRLLERHKRGRAYHYKPAVTRNQLIGLMIRELARQVASGRMEPVLCGFVDLVEEDDPQLMARLEQMVAGRRKRVRADE